MSSSCVFTFLLFHGRPFSEVDILDRNDSNVVIVVSEKSGGTDEKSGPSQQDGLRFLIPLTGKRGRDEARPESRIEPMRFVTRPQQSNAFVP